VNGYPSTAASCDEKEAKKRGPGPFPNLKIVIYWCCDIFPEIVHRDVFALSA
jgi:hypothetical protein